LKKYFSKTLLNNNSELALAVEQIESNYVAKHRTAEQLNLSGGGKLLELRPKNGGNKGDSHTMMAMWKSHVERWQDRTPGIGHLSQTVKNFAMENKEVIVTKFYQDFMLHLCTMEQDNLLRTIDVKQAVDILVDQNDNLTKPKKVHEVVIDDVIPCNDPSPDLRPIIGENFGISDNIDIAPKDLGIKEIYEEIVSDDQINDDQEEEMSILVKEVDEGTTYNNNDDGPDSDDEVELIEVVGNKIFRDKIFEVGQKRKRSLEMMEDGNKRLNYSEASVQERRQLTGNCRCGRTSINKYGKATKSRNENNKTVQISLNFEMSTDAFAQSKKRK